WLLCQLCPYITYTLSLHDALPILRERRLALDRGGPGVDEVDAATVRTGQRTGREPEPPFARIVRCSEDGDAAGVEERIHDASAGPLRQVRCQVPRPRRCRIPWPRRCLARHRRGGMRGSHRPWPVRPGAG